MSNDMMVANANSLMRSGVYDKALVLYEEIKSHYKTSVFDLNIELCKKRIKTSIPSASASASASDFNSRNKDRICLLRIIGNDLPGLHDSMQSYRNLEFILKNEPDFPGVDKFFIINRIVSESKKNKIKWLLNKYKKEYAAMIKTYDETKFKYEQLEIESSQQVAKHQMIKDYINTLKKQNKPLIKFDELMWGSLLKVQQL